MTRTCKWLSLPVFLAQACFFLFVSQHRLIDGDEGFYVLASRLVSQGKVLYLDFFFQQSPLVPYVYGGWLKLFGVSWFSARALAALLTAITGALIYDHVCRETGKWIAGLCATVMFASSSLVFAWFPTVKTFSLGMAPIFLGYVLVARYTRSAAGRWIGLAGIGAGLGVDTRSFLVAVVPVFVWWIYRESGIRRLPHLLWFAAGFVVGILPSLALFLASPSAFLFNNLGYHAIRTRNGLVGDWADKARVISGTFGGRFTGYQFSLTLLICIVFLFVLRRRRDSALLAFWLAIAVGFISILPTPTSMQYFSMMMPFLIVGSVCLTSDYLVSLSDPRRFRLAVRVCAVAMLVYVGFATLSFRQYLYTGYKVPGLRDEADAPNWTLEQVTAVSKAIDQLTAPGEPVAAFWPGYIFASSANPYPGFENNFGMLVGVRLSPENRQKYHIISEPELQKDFGEHGPRIAVVGNQGSWNGAPGVVVCVRMLRIYGYDLAARVGDTAIYKWGSNSQP